MAMFCAMLGIAIDPRVNFKTEDARAVTKAMNSLTKHVDKAK